MFSINQFFHAALLGFIVIPCACEKDKPSPPRNLKACDRLRLDYDALIVVAASGRDTCTPEERKMVGEVVAGTFDDAMQNVQFNEKYTVGYPDGTTKTDAVVSIIDGESTVCTKGLEAPPALLSKFVQKEESSKGDESEKQEEAPAQSPVQSPVDDGSRLRRHRRLIPVDHEATTTNSFGDAHARDARRRLSYWDAYIYRGTGRCRFCIGDNQDDRALKLATMDPTKQESTSLILKGDSATGSYSFECQGECGSIESTLEKKLSEHIGSVVGNQFGGNRNHCFYERTIKVDVELVNSIGGDNEPECA